MNTAIIQFPGTNCDIDTYRVFNELLNVEPTLIWHEKTTDLEKYDAIVLPGGFSYGDRLRAGVIAAYSPIIKQLKKLSLKGKPIIGICNGFQILVESGLLPGALLTNSNLKFICKWVDLKVETNNLFTNSFQSNSIIRMPIAHNEGRYYVSEEKLQELERNNQIVLRYSDSEGNTSMDNNPNGSISNIAAVSNSDGNVLGMMPHPERASDSLLSPYSSDDGIGIFRSMILSLEVMLKE
ncbi:MAG: phosphoribosylformylglycinamidine synthase I [Nitrososphaerales archaeon]|uniref:Phosphoribosylformylglycinamidine synthase subunit PurQ n=1 Tax=uncultured marine thaumarchaeote KM3_10_C07 TaxID=1455986 RepID=A0A075G720_9ARCH|nr:phosphoribosylformylglycinamidine synthase subunit I (purL) [uncultured marine thaumarchaeote KM3_10_C07]MCH2379973.1 phosphoribosylformylglycinamidine synthase I [Nitrososphaerales archaeon]